jgi:protein-S-isoprenylcysteine O-methyltransferase
MLMVLSCFFNRPSFSSFISKETTGLTMTSTPTRAATMTTTPAAAAAAAVPAEPEPRMHVLILQVLQKRLAAIQAHLEFASLSQRRNRGARNSRHNGEDDDDDENEHEEEEEEDVEFEYPQFATKHGLGRVALLASILGIVLGIHLAVALQLTWYHMMMMTSSSFKLFSSSTTSQQPGDNDNDDAHANADVFLDTTTRTQQRRLIDFFAWQWCTYIVTVCTFHGLEFFVTALYNPTVCSADSFLINHSTTYTAAAIASWMEFASTRIVVMAAVRILARKQQQQHAATTTIPRIIQYSVRWWIHWSHWSFALGVVMVVMGQAIRSLAMMTAGESFNHLIQTRRKSNHVLITHGIYAYFRHPSYVGFYYWSIGEQFILSNGVNAVVLAIVACAFFQRRIPYEEESLVVHFPNEYPQYVKRTWMGIPCIPKTNNFAVVETAATKED